jgi:ATP-dependent helicase/nuclease subunit A
MNWTEPQGQAIALRGSHVLCAAAAGSGKTAVLAARVVSRLADASHPVGIDQLLVVTFTRAAAAEMRRRVAGLLRAGAAGNPHLERQLWLLPQADITTLHGFCERTVRRHFFEVGADPSFAILDEADAAALLADCLERLLERRYASGGAAEGTAAFADCVARYGGHRLDTRLRALVLELRRYAQGMPDPRAWLEAAVRPAVDWEAARAAAARRLQRCLWRTARAAAAAPDDYHPALEADRALFLQLLAAVAGPWDAWTERLRTAALVRLPSAGQRDAGAALARTLRQANREELADLAAGPFGRSVSEHVAEAALVAEHLRPLTDLALSLEGEYGEAKAKAGVLDFDDLEHRCLDILRGPAGAAVAARYAEVLVDESQDLSPVQDEILERLVAGGPRLFCVGDVRQSIYGFRQAEPRRFARREARYAAGAGRLIALPHNFRSQRSLVAAVNFLFGTLFRCPGAEVPASALEPMQAARPDPPPAAAAVPARLLLLEGDVDEDGTALEREAAAVAGQVASWLATARVHDPEAAESLAPFRPARAGDVAILLRAPGTTAAAYAEALRAAGIPCWTQAQGSRSDSPEVRTVIAWWQTLANPLQDIPLAATLLGPFGGFRAAELAEIRLAAVDAPLWMALGATAAAGGRLGERAAAFRARLDRWRVAARQGPWAELLARALDESGYRAEVAALPDGAERCRDLDWCLARCRDVDRLPTASLAQVVAALAAGGGETAAEAAAAAADAVRVLSIHGSKGLEFPCVVVAGLGRRFHGREGSADVLAHWDLGVHARRVDLDRRVRWPTLGHAVAAARREEEARAEELRILYVALTRARDALCLVGTLPGLAQRLGDAVIQAEGSDEGVAPLDLATGSCYLDWLLPVLARHADVAPCFGAHAGIPYRGLPDPGGSRWEVVLHLGPVADEAAAGVQPHPPSGPGADDQPPHPDPRGACGDGGTEEAERATWARLEAESAWRYPWAAATRMPAKAGVGEWLDRWRRAASQGAEDAPVPWDAAGAVGRTLELSPPRVLVATAASPADVGTATHTLLRHLDLGGPCDLPALAACRTRLLQRGLLVEAAAAGIDLAAVARFLTGPLGRRLRAQPAAVRRELGFSLRLPAASLPPGDPALQGEWVLVQGVVDALLIEPHGLVLLDYKTDAEGAAAASRYRPQVQLYARAMAAAWQLPAREAWLCFLATGEELAVPLP